MRPKERRETGEQDMFRSRLDQIIDLDHALVKLAKAIDWRLSFPIIKSGRIDGAIRPRSERR